MSAVYIHHMVPPYGPSVAAGIAIERATMDIETYPHVAVQQGDGVMYVRNYADAVEATCFTDTGWEKQVNVDDDGTITVVP